MNGDGGFIIVTIGNRRSGQSSGNMAKTHNAILFKKK